MPTLEELRQVDQLAERINIRLDAMYAKLGKLVVVAERVNETSSNLPSCSNVHHQTQPNGRPTP